ncbi:hypothetical protein E8F20_02555 [Pseudomonas sp. BN415]|uniref:lipoyl protein ligase domain-containing protein n=1 Tax=Pseudomonas sp. BN415 TaxID=2567889 RepID=UPI00245809C7|nr:hypothetical protein [Pseudomonas sp. BN415]MDH4580752.1 hypothetical protein [Pseudomonas sp. BN415]
MLDRCRLLIPSVAESAHEELRWIEAGIRGGISTPQWQLVRYRAPALIYGRSSPVMADVERRARLIGCEVIQRRTGGGAVFAGPWMLGCNILLPATHPWSQGSHIVAFREFGELWMRSLAALGVSSSMAESRHFQERDVAVRSALLQWSCFAGLSHGEGLDNQGRKLLGLAQARSRWGSLLSAGLLLSSAPWEAMEFLHHGQVIERSRMHAMASDGIGPQANAADVEQQLSQRIPSALVG